MHPFDRARRSTKPVRASDKCLVAVLKKLGCSKNLAGPFFKFSDNPLQIIIGKPIVEPVDCGDRNEVFPDFENGGWSIRERKSPFAKWEYVKIIFSWYNRIHRDNCGIFYYCSNGSHLESWTNWPNRAMSSTDQYRVIDCLISEAGGSSMMKSIMCLVDAQPLFPFSPKHLRILSIEHFPHCLTRKRRKIIVSHSNQVVFI